MARAQLPQMPDFAALETEATKFADRQTMILALIGNLVFSWANNESMFIYILMILLDSDEATAAIVFATLNTTRARIDLIQRLASVKVTEPEIARTLTALIKQFNTCTRLRNEFNHCMYVVNEHGEITHLQSMRLEEGRGQLRFGVTRKLDGDAIQQIIQLIERLKTLNRDIWAFLPRLQASIGSAAAGGGAAGAN
ncbi:MAG TPA: hypothetical protein VND87_13275 [Stellaceae bacterium]|nr:hypothetical protein [Stellaceae bacterium]